jgi:hypothetical protein
MWRWRRDRQSGQKALFRNVGCNAETLTDHLVTITRKRYNPLLHAFPSSLREAFCGESCQRRSRVHPTNGEQPPQTKLLKSFTRTSIIWTSPELQANKRISMTAVAVEVVFSGGSRRGGKGGTGCTV